MIGFSNTNANALQNCNINKIVYTVNLFHFVDFITFFIINPSLRLKLISKST